MQSTIAEAEASKAELDKEERGIDYREQNAKVAYVCVISNVGCSATASTRSV